jgi:hypothetical protein
VDTRFTELTGTRCDRTAKVYDFMEWIVERSHTPDVASYYGVKSKGRRLSLDVRRGNHDKQR